MAAWTAAKLTSSIRQINIESSSRVKIKVPHPDKVETGHKWMTFDVNWGEVYLLRGSSIGYSVVLCDVLRHVSALDGIK